MGAHSLTARDVEPGSGRRKRGRIVAVCIVAAAAAAIAALLAAYGGGVAAYDAAPHPLSEVVPSVSADAERVAVAEWRAAGGGGEVVDLTDDAAELMSFAALFNGDGERVARTGACDIPPGFDTGTAYMVRVKPADPGQRTVTLAVYPDGSLWASATSRPGGGIDPMGAMYALDDGGALYSACKGLFTEGGE